MSPSALPFLPPAHLSSIHALRWHPLTKGSGAMDENTRIVLSGRTLTTRQAISMSASSAYHCGEIDDGQQPLVGDLRLSATIDSSVRTSGAPGDAGRADDGKRGRGAENRGPDRPNGGGWRGEAHPPCQGAVIASIFDGVCWQRFDVASITRTYRFNNCAQLTAVLRWVRTSVASSAGRPCTLRPANTDRGTPAAYILEPLAGPVPSTASAAGAAAGLPEVIAPPALAVTAPDGGAGVAHARRRSPQ